MRLMLLTLLTFLLSPAFAQPGTLDPSFGNNGAMSLTLGDMLIIPTSVATNNDGQIFVGGNHPDFDYGGTSILLVKLLEDGSLDLNFAEAGIYHVKDEDAPWHENTLNAVAVQPDGKIIISGMTETPGVRMHYVTRLLPNGSPDPTFGTNGTVLRQYPTGNASDLYQTWVRSVRVLPDGKLLTVSNGVDQQGGSIFYDAILCARFLSNGQPDPDFGDGGYKILAYNNIFWLYPNILGNNDTSIILFINGAGYFSLLSIDEDGEPVGGFGTDGIASLPQYNMELVFFNTPATHLPDGKIVVGFRWYVDDYTTKYYVVRLQSDGSPDVAFNGTGMLEIVTNSNESFIGKSIQFLQDENAIIITGTLYDIDENMIPTGSRLRTYRILNNGSIDGSYGDSGYKEEDLGFWVATLEAGAALPDGKVVLAGYSMQGYHFNLTPRLLVVRLNNDGEPEGILADRLTTTGSEIMQLHIGEHGKILMVGNNTAGPRKELLLRLLTSEGSFDPDFSANVGPYTPVSGFDLQAFDMAVTDDAIIVAGYINTEDEGINNLLVAKFTPDGLLDTDFGVMGSVSTEDKGINARAIGIAIQDNGKILAGGAKDNKPYLARFNTNGSWDNGFGNNGELFTDDAGIIHDLLITPGQEILATANNPVAGGNRDFILYKITPTGVLDAGFGIGGKLKVDMGTNNDLSQHLARYTDGSLLISGAVGAGTGFVKLLPNGNIDTGFGNNGRTYLLPGPVTGIGDMLLQENGSILAALTVKVGDYFSLSVARLTALGEVDSTFGMNGLVYIGNPTKNHFAQSLALTPEGDIMFTGTILSGTEPSGSILAKIMGGVALGQADNRSDKIGLFIFPQPIKESFTLEYSLEMPQQITLQMFDIQGRLMSTVFENLTSGAGKHRVNIPVKASLPAGTYFLRLGYGNESRTIQFVKQ